MDDDQQYIISRRVFSQADFNAAYMETPKASTPAKIRFIQKLKSFTCLHLISDVFPFYQILASFYTLRAFASDIISGLTMSILHIPQGMAYGLLAGLEPINGLYTSFFPPLAYFFFGTSRHISIGTFSIVALLSSQPVEQMSEIWKRQNTSVNFTTADLQDYRLEVSVTVTILSGLIQLAMGLFRLGSLVVYISAPLLGGFTCASAVHVLCSQLNGLFGMRIENHSGPGRLIFIVYEFFKEIKTVNVASSITSIICITVLSVFKFVINPKVVAKIKFPIPIELIILILGTVVSHYARLHERFGVKIVGNLPQGLPQPMLPNFSIAPHVILPSFIVSLVALTTTVSLVKLYAIRDGYDVRYTQEMSALGIANIFGGFFRCHAASGALARTSLSYSAGMRSQLASLVSCLVLLLVLTVIGPLFESVPLAVLSSLIAVSLTGILKQVQDIPKLYRIYTLDMLIWIVTFLATVFIDVPYGLVVGVLFSLLTILYRTQTAFRRELRSLSGTDLYVDKKRYETFKRSSKIIILRFGGPLYYANAESFQQWIYKTTDVNPIKLYKQSQIQHQNHSCAAAPTCIKHSRGLHCCSHLSSHSETESVQLEQRVSPHPVGLQNQLRFIILDVSSWGFVDSVGATVFCDLVKTYKRINVNLLCTCCEPHARRTIIKSGLSASDFDDLSFVTLHDAVLYAEHVLSSELTEGTEEQQSTPHVNNV